MKKGLWILGSVLALIVLIVLLAPILVDVNKFAPEIESRLENATGKKIKVGTLQLSLNPPLTVRIRNVRIEDPTLPEGKSLLVCPLMEVSIDPWSYLQGQLKIVTLSLQKPNLLLGPAALRKAADSKPQPVSGKPSGRAVTISKIRLDKLTVGVFDAGGDPAAPDFRLEDVDVYIPEIDTSNPFSMDSARADVHLAGAKLTAASLGVPLLFGSGTARVAGNHLSLDDLQGELDGTHLAGKISAEPLDKPTIRFQLHISELSAEKLQSWVRPRSARIPPYGVGIPPPGSNAPRLEGTLAIDRFVFGSHVAEKVQTRLRVQGSDVEIEKLEGAFCDGELESKGKIRLEGGEPSYHLTSKLRKANLAKLLFDHQQKLELVSGLLEMDIEVTGAGLALHEESGLRNMRASGRFSVGEGSFRTINLLERVRFLSLIPGLNASAGNFTNFLSLRSDFRFDGQRVDTQRMELLMDPLRLLLTGYFTLKGDLDYVATTSGTAPEQSNSLVGAILGMVSRNVNVSFQIRGNLLHPEIIPLSAQGK